MIWERVWQNFINFLKNLYRNSKNYFWIMFLIAIFLNLLVWYLWQEKIILEFRYVYSPIILENIRESQAQYLIPALGSFFSLINLLLALFTIKRVRLAAYFLVGGSILIEILILILIRFYMRF